MTTAENTPVGLSLSADTRAVLLRALFFTLLFGLAAHAFRYFGLAFTHDATLVYQQDDIWQIRLGRFLQPVYLALRGRLAAPFLVGLLSLLYLSAAVFLLSRLLGLTSSGSIALLAGLLSTNATLTFSNASYLPWADLYMLSLLLAVAGVYLWRRFRWGFLAGILPLCLSAALYGSYFQAAVFLCLLLLVRQILERETPRPAQIVSDGCKALVTLLGALALYAAVYRLVLGALGLDVATAYNSAAKAMDFSGVQFFPLLKNTYLYVLNAFLRPETYRPGLVAAVHALLALFTAAALIVLLRRRKFSPIHYLLLAGLLALMPLGINAVFFLSKGMSHSLMTFSFALGGVFPLTFWNMLNTEGQTAPRPGLGTVFRLAAPVCLGVILFCNVVFANQVYLKTALTDDNTRSVLTRVLDRVEQTEGYIPGESPVALIGDLNQGPLNMDRPGFEAVAGIGLERNFSVTNYVAYDYYFQYVLGYPVNLVPREEAMDYAQVPQVQALAVFPARGCTLQLPDGVVVIRLS